MSHFRIKVKIGRKVLNDFTVYSPSSFAAWDQHFCLVPPGGYLLISKVVVA